MQNGRFPYARSRMLNDINMLGLNDVFFYDKYNIFYENIEYCRIRSNDFEYLIFS